MPTFSGELVADWADSFGRGAVSVFTRYRELVQAQPAVPRDTGALEDGIDYIRRDTRGSDIVAVLASTARSPEGADYGTILDESRGQIIRPVNRRALANTRTGWGPYASARLTTAHVDWWARANPESLWDTAADELSRFNL